MAFLKKLAFWLISFTAASAVAAFVVKKTIPSYGDETDDTFSVVAAMTGVAFESKTPGLLEGRATAFTGGIEMHIVEVRGVGAA